MSGDSVAHVVASVMCLTLVGSALLVRRLSLGSTLRMAAAWIGIFALAYVLFLFRGEAGAVWSRIASDIGIANPRDTNGTVRITKSADGHFWARASVNGQPVRFLIDSGATVSMITPDIAAAAGIEPLDGPAIPIETANGTISARPARIGRLQLGPITQTEARVLIGPAGSSTNVLGMTFLSALSGWRVEGDALTLLNGFDLT